MDKQSNGLISDIVNLINVNFAVFGAQRCQILIFDIFDIYSLLYTLGFVQTKLVHSIFLFFPLFFGQKHFCLLGLNSDSRGWSLIMVGLISDNSVFSHIYTQMRYKRTINCVTVRLWKCSSQPTQISFQWSRSCRTFAS